MGDDETYILCPLCSQRVEPDGPGVVYAVEQHNIVTMGTTESIDEMGTIETIDGMGGFFHPGCSPEAIGWVRRDRPQTR